MAKVKKTKIKKVKKKKWVTIIAPKLFNEAVLGEIPTIDMKTLLGKLITVNMMNITRNPKLQGINLKFAIISLQSNDRVGTELVGYEIIPASIKRMVRRRKSRIDDSFSVMSSDERKVRVKPFILTLNKANQSTNTAIIRATREFFIRTIAKSNYETFIKSLVTKKVQKELYDSIKKIYPIAVCEIRVMKLENRDVLRGE